MYEGDIDDFVDAELKALSIAQIKAEETGSCKEDVITGDLLEDGYSKNSQKIARYLTTLQSRLAGLDHNFRSRPDWTEKFRSSLRFLGPDCKTVPII